MKNNLISGMVKFAALMVCALMAAALVPSENKMLLSDHFPAEKNLHSDIQSSVLSLNDSVNTEIFHLPKVYTLPMDLSPAPKPNPACFTEDSYQDDTITVKCWHENIKINKKTVTANFADITIAHPTQLRTAFAGGSYGTSKRLAATKIAAANNAVIAVNADFYNYRPEGVIVRQGTLYRNVGFNVDTLFIDADGNFSVVRDDEAIEGNYLKKHQISQTLVFGPVLVKDGKAVQVKNGKYYSVVCGQHANNPRTAIGQLGRLHYLLCTIDGRSKTSIGTSTNELAQVMADKKCLVAYNLDGGQSTSMVFKNRLYNAVSNGGERSITDIVYFASAIPESEWN